MDIITIMLATLILMASETQPVISHCTLTTELYSEQECIGRYECSDTVGNLHEQINLWDCAMIRPRTVCHNYCTYINAPVENYWLKIKVVNVSENTYDVGTNIYELRDHVTMMTVTNGNMTFVPSDMYSLGKLLVLDVSHNKIRTIDLPMSMKLEKLNVFNASFNWISELTGLEATSYQGYRTETNLTILDLSHNGIKFIPDYYFSKFYNLLHLNMSYNNINSFSLLTFEGLTGLETLYLSNNNVQEVGLTLARFSNLKKLKLNHNYLSSIEENNFKTLLCLTELNLSFNKIIFIDDFSFRNMVHIKSLQLNDNNIKTISKLMLINNNALQEIDFSNNQICKIEPFLFKGKNITVCNFKNNALTSLDERSIFEGIRTKELDLSKSKIKSLGENVFVELHSDLQKINLSTNSITTIHKSSFRSLDSLSALDLSNNNLQTIEFDMTNLVRLFSFNIENNQIRKITKDTFRHLKSLTNLNLSNNAIVEIEKFSFHDLEKLQVLDLSKNDLPDILVTDTFHGLSETSHFYLMHSKTTSLQDSAFSSMTNLFFFNASFGNIRILEHNVFNGTNIWFLDLSHNSLEIFSLNNTNMKYVKKIFLNDNRIENLTNETFYGLNLLNEINLNNNNILSMSIDTFRRLQTFSVLHLSSNTNIMLDGSVFSNISTLRDVELQNLWKPFNFDNSINTTIEILDLTSSNIADINSVMIYKLTKLQTLLLISNKIRFIDRYSFQNLSSLISLDLSNNMISIIKPGSFVGTCELSFLNLHNNNLTSLFFGVFDGLSNLQVLNLSSNAIRVFQGRLFHNSHRLSVISLEDNLIENIDFKELKEAAIPKITIGGNLIPCDILVASKQKEYYGVRVTSEKLIFHVENIDGISCEAPNIVTNPIYQRVEHEIEKQSVENDIRGHSLGSSSSQIISNQLDSLRSAIYFEASCLLLIVCLLSGITVFVYFKLRSKLVRTYSLTSRRHLTANDMEIEL